MESCNPSGSYKDRFIEREFEHLLTAGCKRVIATSSGNTGAALASHAARHGVQCAIFANADAPAGKLAQMRAHGATVVRVPGFAANPQITADVFAVLREYADVTGVPLIVSAYRYCPLGMAGVETISRELGEDFQHVFVPVGGGGLYAAVVRGFGSRVRVHAVQPAGCATVVDAWLRGSREAAPAAAATAISGLSVPMDIDATLALTRLYECGGQGIAVTDEEVFEAQRRLLREEGIYCEPAGAAAFAGFCKADIPLGERAVCLVTGHGFKDPTSIDAAAARWESPLVDSGDVRRFLDRC